MAAPLLLFVLLLAAAAPVAVSVVLFADDGTEEEDEVDDDDEDEIAWPVLLFFPMLAPSLEDDGAVELRGGTSLREPACMTASPIPSRLPSCKF